MNRSAAELTPADRMRLGAGPNSARLLNVVARRAKAEAVARAASGDRAATSAARRFAVATSPARRAFASARMRSSVSKVDADSCSRSTAPRVSPSR